MRDCITKEDEFKLVESHKNFVLCGIDRITEKYLENEAPCSPATAGQGIKAELRRS